MGTRNRVLSFMSQFSSNRDSQRSPTPTSYQQAPQTTKFDNLRSEPPRQERPREPTTPTRSNPHYRLDGDESPPARVQRERVSSRPMSMIQTYQPPLMDVSRDTLPELQPIFTFLNSHGNKLYQEGYFLKLDDQNTHGRANADRTWTECFAQLVGTVLSLWDAAELDVAGQDGEVLPKFINLTDASIKMIESLPTRSANEAPLQNVLSISTAGKNRYLLHFNSHHSLIQWTAGIRLAMFEHATLQEAYTGALIAGKGKGLNNINVLMERSKFKSEDWARVRFGAGTPWRRCWCVITPPDEKEMQKLQKQMNKKKSAYDRSRIPLLKGDIKFYDTKKTKKVQPIATITDAYSAFAIYPQSKPLIDASTLVKVEGNITIHSNPPSTTEGFVFVMPEVHPAVTGFEMMLRWLFPVFDTFHLYGRPGRLIADTSDPKSLMFAMPKHRRYGYLEILDVTGLILEQGSSSWKESEWRRRMKDLTGKRMAAIESGSRRDSRYSSRRSTRNSFGPSQSRIRFDDGASVRSTPSVTWAQAAPPEGPDGIPRIDSAPPGPAGFNPPQQNHAHQRSVSDTNGLDRYQEEAPSHYDGAYEEAPTPPPHAVPSAPGPEGSNLRFLNDVGSAERISSEDEQPRATPVRELQELQATSTPEPVAPPPAFSHAPGSMPISKPYHSPELRRANSRMSNATLHQLVGASGGAAAAYNANQERPSTGESPRRREAARYSEEMGSRGVISDATTKEIPANQGGLDEGLVAANPRFSFEHSPSRSANTDPRAEHAPIATFPLTSSERPNANHPVEADTFAAFQPFNSPAPSTLIYQPPQVFSRDSDPPSFRERPTPDRQYHSAQPSYDSVMSTTSQPSRLRTSQSITRKPLPARTSSMQTPTSGATPSSAGSLAQNAIDQAAFDMIGQGGDRKLTRLPETQIQRKNSGVSSLYEDAASTASPDYASTIHSAPRESAEKQRTGVMRTVGNVDIEEHGPTGNNSGASLVPDIDFGPTFNLTSGRNAGRRSPLRSQSPVPGYSSAGYRAPQTPNAGRDSPGPAINYYPQDRVSAQRAAPPGSGLQSSNASGPSSRDARTPEHLHYRNESGDSRTLPWQPGMSTISPTRQSITPEQFVQQRAAAAATPLYAHQRQASSNTIRGNTPTPPLIPNRSSDALTQQAHSRNASAELLQRPGSRDPSASYGASGTGDLATNLSAREQEHLARVTGQPLINIAQNNSRPGTSGGGLIGAIETREREKQQMKAGINSQAVQHAIAQRQQQALQQQYAEQYPAEYVPPQQHYGQYPQPQLHSAQGQGQRQQTWAVSPAANVFAQGGGWTAPSPGFVAPGEQGRQSPQFYPGQQQQYFGQHPQQQGQGRGGPASYYGQGY